LPLASCLLGGLGCHQRKIAKWFNLHNFLGSNRRNAASTFSINSSLLY
jgi:hypothetical protein